MSYPVVVRLATLLTAAMLGGLPTLAHGQPLAAPGPGAAATPPPTSPQRPQPHTLPPIELPYQPGLLTPPGYHLVESAREDIVVSGAALFGLTYLPVASFAGTMDLLGTLLPDAQVEGIRFLYIPVAGPFLMASRHFEGGNALRITLLSVLGVAQATGLVLMIVGLGNPDRSWVRDDLPEVALVPALIDGGTPGLVFLGRL